MAQDQELIDWMVRNFGEQTRTNKANNHAHQPPSDEPLSWDKSGVMRLDDAVCLVKMTIARIALSEMPQQSDDLMKDLRDKANEMTIAQYGKAKLSTLLRASWWIMYGWTQLVNVFREDRVQSKLEERIRSACLKSMREALKHRLKPSNVRRYKTVASRVK